MPESFLPGGFFAASLSYTSAGLLVSLSSSVKLAARDGFQLFAGAGLSGFAGDGAAADSATRFAGPTGVTADRAGNLYVVDQGNARIRKISVDGVVSTFAGSGVITFSGDGGPATTAGMVPYGIAAGPAGDIFISDYFNNRVRRVDASGVITTFAGNGVPPTLALPLKDGEPAVSMAITPSGIATDALGNLYIADTRASLLLRITVDGLAHLVSYLPRTSPDMMFGLVFDPHSVPITIAQNGDVFVALAGWIYRFGPNGSFEVFEPAFKLIPPIDVVAYNSIAFDAAGTLYASVNNPPGLFSVSPEGVVATYLRYGRPGMSTADGQAFNSENVAKGLTLDVAGNIYLSDNLAGRIRVIPAGCLPPTLP